MTTLRKNGGVTERPSLPAHPRPRNIGLVFAGGALGVFTRELLMLALPDGDGPPIAVFVANIVGAFLLGLLLESLVQRGTESSSEAGKFTAARLLLGTGLLGGFTTYSALAQAIALLFQVGDAWLAIGYGLVTVVLGATASWGGMLLGALPKRSRGLDV